MILCPPISHISAPDIIALRIPFSQRLNTTAVLIANAPVGMPSVFHLILRPAEVVQHHLMVVQLDVWIAHMGVRQCDDLRERIGILHIPLWLCLHHVVCCCSSSIG